MVFTGVIISSSTGTPEPNFDAPAADIERYLETQDPWAVAVGGFLLAFGLVAWLWFVCGLAAALRRSGARPDFLSTVVLVSGTAAVAVMLTGAPQASEYRGGDRLDPQVAQFAFDLTACVSSMLGMRPVRLNRPHAAVTRSRRTPSCQDSGDRYSTSTYTMSSWTTSRPRYPGHGGSMQTLR
jgi:hypothetical protein